MPSPQTPLTVPQETAKDKAIAVAKALLGDIVPLGGTFVELATQFIRSPYEQRMREWQEQVGEALHQLASERGVRLEDLQADPRFVDTVLHATQVAMRNANQEKRAALRNALINSGLPEAPDESRRQMFLGYVDTFTPWHLRLLALFDDPVEWFTKHGRAWPDLYSGARVQVLELAFTEAKPEAGFFRQVWRDLFLSGLVDAESLGGAVTAPALRQPLTSPIGRQFLGFISAPK